MVSEYTQRAAESIVGQLDAKISEFINPEWTVEEIKRRCALVRQSGIPYESLHIDGQPVLDIYPVEFEQEMKGDRIIMRMTQRFRELPKEDSDNDV